MGGIVIFFCILYSFDNFLIIEEQHTSLTSKVLVVIHCTVYIIICFYTKQKESYLPYCISEFFFIEPNRNQENEQGKRESSGICNQTNSPSKKEQINDKNQDFGAGSNLAAPDGDLITGQNLKIVQAICIACQQLIPNLFDVMDKTLAESELISSVLVHKCENCESPINTDAEFVFPGR